MKKKFAPEKILSEPVPNQMRAASKPWSSHSNFSTVSILWELGKHKTALVTPKSPVRSCCLHRLSRPPNLDHHPTLLLKTRNNAFNSTIWFQNQKWTTAGHSASQQQSLVGPVAAKTRPPSPLRAVRCPNLWTPSRAHLAAHQSGDNFYFIRPAKC